MELAAAIRSGDPPNYISHLPTHQVSLTVCVCFTMSIIYCIAGNFREMQDFCKKHFAGYAYPVLKKIVD